MKAGKYSIFTLTFWMIATLIQFLLGLRYDHWHQVMIRFVYFPIVGMLLTSAQTLIFHSEPFQRLDRPILAVALMSVVSWVITASGAALYMPAGGYRSLTGAQDGSGRIALIDLKEGSDETQFIGLLEQHFDLAGLTATSVQTSKIAAKIIRNHLDVIIVILGVLAFLMLIVSSLGMASGIGTSVVERTRELGVLRAIGATPRAIRGILSAESIFIAITAWLTALCRPGQSIPVRLLRHCRCRISV